MDPGFREGSDSLGWLRINFDRRADTVHAVEVGAEGIAAFDTSSLRGRRREGEDGEGTRCTADPESGNYFVRMVYNITP
jgi:hypothetical protein